MCESNHRPVRPGSLAPKKFSSVLSEAKQSLEFSDSYIEGGAEDEFDEGLPAGRQDYCSCPFQEDDEESLGTKQMVYLVGNYLN